MLHLGWCRLVSSACGLRCHVPCRPSCCYCCDGGSTSGSKTRRAAVASATMSSSLSLSSASESVGGKVSAASETVGGKWGRWLKLTASSRTSGAAAGIALIE
jgi:hypothetical protein